MCIQITYYGLNIGRLTCLKRNELRFENRYNLSAQYTPTFRTGVIVFIIVRTDVSSERIVVNIKYIRFVLNDQCFICTIKSVNTTLHCMYHHFLCEIYLRRHQSNSMYFHTTVFVIVLWCIVNKRTANKRDHCIRHCVVVYCEQAHSQQNGPLYSSLRYGVL